MCGVFFWRGNNSFRAAPPDETHRNKKTRQLHFVYFPTPKPVKIWHFKSELLLAHIITMLLTYYRVSGSTASSQSAKGLSVNK